MKPPPSPSIGAALAVSEKPYFAPHVMLCYAAETENNRSTRPSVGAGMQRRTHSARARCGGIVCVRPRKAERNSSSVYTCHVCRQSCSRLARFAADKLIRGRMKKWYVRTYMRWRESTMGKFCAVQGSVLPVLVQFPLTFCISLQSFL